MKNKIFLLLILLITSNSCVFAGQEPTVISGSTSKKQAYDSIEDVNQYTNNFFTPKITNVVVEDPKAPKKR